MKARFVRTTAFVRKELLEIWRQPRLLLTLVVGPFVILGLFGAGLRDDEPPADYIILGPEDGAVRELAARLVERMPRQLSYKGYLTDTDAALHQLRSDDVDLVISLPSDPAQSVLSGRRALIRVYHDVVDPIETRAVSLASQQAGDRVNRALSRRIVEQSQDVVRDAGAQLDRVRDAHSNLRAAAEGRDPEVLRASRAILQREIAELSRLMQGGPQIVAALDAEAPSLTHPLVALRAAANGVDVGTANRLRDDLLRVEQSIDRLDAALAAYETLPSDVVVSPFLAVAERVGPGGIGLTDFYAPAVVVVLIQHMLISFLTLSMVREQDLGTVDTFRIAPVTAGEIIAGKYLAYLILGLTSAAMLLTLLVVGLNVPLRGSLVLLVVAALATFTAAVSVGFSLALFAESNSQAVQYAMLVLLGSIFFSGFILSLTRFHPPLDLVSRALPATYGVSLFRDVMLRGRSPAAVDLGSLAAFGVGLTVLNWLLLRRRLRPQ